MKLIGISSQKGGVGKTTLSMNLAIASALSGKPTIIFDLDPQQSIKGYHNIRVGQGQGDQPMVVATTATKIGEALNAAKADGYEIGFIDTPPNIMSKDAQVAAGADVVIVPTTPSVIDLVAISSSIEIAHMKDAYGFALINMATHYGDHVEKTRNSIEEGLNFPVCPVTVGQRIDFVKAAEHGMGVLEFAPNSKAAEEIQALWRFVETALKGATKTTTRKAVANG